MTTRRMSATSKMFDGATLESFRETAPAKSNWTGVTQGLWKGGRVYTDEFGDVVFVPVGTSRSVCPAPGPLTFLGDGLRNVFGWGDRESPGSFFPEVRMTNPVVP